VSVLHHNDENSSLNLTCIRHRNPILFLPHFTNIADFSRSLACRKSIAPLVEWRQQRRRRQQHNENNKYEPHSRLAVRVCVCVYSSLRTRSTVVVVVVVVLLLLQCFGAGGSIKPDLFLLRSPKSTANGKQISALAGPCCLSLAESRAAAGKRTVGAVAAPLGRPGSGSCKPVAAS
jgi:hypothetical protein